MNAKDSILLHILAFQAIDSQIINDICTYFAAVGRKSNDDSIVETTHAKNLSKLQDSEITIIVYSLKDSNCVLVMLRIAFIRIY